MNKGDEGFIPLLSKKPLCLWSDEEYLTYIKGLKKSRKVKTSVVKKKGNKEKVIKVKRLKRGQLSVTTTRKPKYITAEEYDRLSLEFRENELFIAIKAAGVRIYENHEEAEKASKGDEL